MSIALSIFAWFCGCLAVPVAAGFYLLVGLGWAAASVALLLAAMFASFITIEWLEQFRQRRIPRSFTGARG